MIRIEITSDPLLAPAPSEIACAADGAVVWFAGVVRDSSDGSQVDFLEYESYEQMAIPRMTQIAQEATEKWGLSTVLMSHRTGKLEIGETSVVVAVSAPHREQAFEACKYCIDTLKTSVAIWKKEIFTSGASHWVESGEEEQ